tara:strand:+ start:1027 stop:2124 length:1098 start_codon:yes stop_codon:yes gene_type:complete
MAVKNFETLNTSTDVTTTRTLLHEAIPLTGTIVSGTYFETYLPTGETNVKNYSHGMFQSVYDYPYLSSSANHIFDLTIGYASTSPLSSSTNEQNAKKINIYNTMAQALLGYDVSQSIETFESDLDLTDDDSQMTEVFFVNFSRLLTKDQVKKGTFSITLGTGSFAVPFAAQPAGVTLTDLSASDDGGTNPNVNGGEYGLLYNSPVTSSAVGAVFYQAGVAVITASIFASASFNETLGEGQNDHFIWNNAAMYGITGSWTDLPISASCDAIRRRIYNLSFNNTTELNSTIYFCRAAANKFNYSGNPTYTTGSKLVVKNVATDTPLSYITTVGLYSANNELLAVAKLSEPLEKNPETELTLRVRLDY